MTADARAGTPDLPPDFGNPWMSNLQEVSLPEPIPWTPEAAGWWLLGALLALLAIVAALRLARRRRARAYRREALVRLAEIRHRVVGPPSSSRALVELPRLMKRTALSAYPRADVAGLSGDRWLGFLDRSYGGTGFTTGPGNLLPELAYGREPEGVDEERVEALFGLAERWIRRHEEARKAPRA